MRFQLADLSPLTKKAVEEMERRTIMENNKMVDIDKAIEFIEDYAFKDTKEVYTNGAMLIEVYRVKQALIDRAYLGFCEG